MLKTIHKLIQLGKFLGIPSDKIRKARCRDTIFEGISRFIATMAHKITAHKIIAFLDLREQNGIALRLL